MTLLNLLVRTPPWVFVLGLALLALGLLQSTTRRVPLPAAVLPSLVIAVVSLTGVMATFRGNGLVGLGWALAAAGALVLARAAGLWRGVRAEGRRIVVPGSWAPLVLLMGLFALRWASGVALALQPSLASAPPFVLGVGAAGGLVSGLFLARARVALDVRQRRLAAA
jgi:hypothetical protein